MNGAGSRSVRDTREKFIHRPMADGARAPEWGLG